MIYLVLAVASSAAISIAMRASEKHVKNEIAMFMSNYLVCMALSFGFMENKAQFISTAGSSSLTILLGGLSGVMFLANFLFYKYNMKHNGVVMSATFMKLGVLVPTIMAVAVFGEMPRMTQVIGIFVAIGAIVLINFEKDALSEGKHMLFLILLLLLSGFTDSMANVFDKIADPAQKDTYLLATFGTAFLITVILAYAKKIKVGKMDFLFGALIGIPNYFSSRFLILSLQEINAVLVYPTYSVATMITIAVAGILIFREKISPKKLCALGLILLALVLLNV